MVLNNSEEVGEDSLAFSQILGGKHSVSYVVLTALLLL